MPYPTVVCVFGPQVHRPQVYTAYACRKGTLMRQHVLIVLTPQRSQGYILATTTVNMTLIYVVTMASDQRML